jgi:hypothetical protein
MMFASPVLRFHTAAAKLWLELLPFAAFSNISPLFWHLERSRRCRFLPAVTPQCNVRLTPPEIETIYRRYQVLLFKSRHNFSDYRISLMVPTQKRAHTRSSQDFVSEKFRELALLQG